MKLGVEDNKRIAERAARYLGALIEGNEEREAFFAWLAESPRHVEEFLFVLQAAQRAAGFTEEQERRIAQTEETVEGNVVKLEDRSRAEPGLTPPLSTRKRRRGKWTALAAAVVAAAGLGWWLLPALIGGQTYTTAIGEQRTVKLADGSMVLLNTASRLEVRFAEGRRALELVSGEALFTVARDPARPFRVRAGGTIVEAVGTQFGVYRHAAGTRVSVLEGTVQVSADSQLHTSPGIAEPASARLTAGEAASIAPDGRLIDRRRLDPAKAVAWQQRRLVFEDETLAAIVAEFNRYNVAPRIHVLDEAAGARRFSGTFDADAPETMVNTLVGDETLAVARTQDRITIGTAQTPGAGP
jgi:transmembrane sensor